MTARPPIHLWIYNHPLHGISDQIEFLTAILRENNYPLTVSRQPRRAALNIVIENFAEPTAAILRDFCRESGKRVAVIMTEHLDFIGREIFVHGDPLWNDNDYMHPATQIARIRNLMDCCCHLRGFLVLGDLPELINIDQMLPGLAVRTLPFPQLARPVPTADWPALPADLIFTGAITKFREEVLEIIGTALIVRHPDGFLSRKARDQFSRTGRLVLNIPQRADWRWLSLMRIIAALRCGRATVSLATCDNSQIAQACFQLDIHTPDLRPQLQSLAANAAQDFATQFAAYHDMAAGFRRTHPFPADFFDYWAVTEL